MNRLAGRDRDPARRVIGECAELADLGVAHFGNETRDQAAVKPANEFRVFFGHFDEWAVRKGNDCGGVTGNICTVDRTDTIPTIRDKGVEAEAIEISHQCSECRPGVFERHSSSGALRATNGLGIIGAVVTLMGMLAFPAMLKAGYDESFAAGVICAGGCLGILIPPSIMLIVYSAIAEISPLRLYAAAMFPGLLLAVGVHTWWRRR